MTFEIVAVIAIGAALLGASFAAARTRTLQRVSRALRTPSGADVEYAAEQVVARASAAEANAERSARDLASLVDLAGCAIVRINDQRVIVAANTSVHRLLGRADGSLIGRSVMEAFADHHVEDIAIRGSAGGPAERELTLREGARPTVTVRAARAPGGGTWIVLEDVSELRRLQRYRAEFLDNLSHELRTPLTNIRLLAETLGREVADREVPPAVRERIARIDVESGHLAQMVSEVLDLARMEDGTGRLVLAEVNVAALAGRALQRLSVFADHNGVALVDAAPADLPPVIGDEGRLVQLLVNLLHNAVKFSPQGGTVTLRGARAGDEVTLAVEDHGIGIPRAEQGRVFERFYKVDRARLRGAGGTGLGLTIARHIAEGHGGRIWVESEEGRGSTFSVALPIGGPRSGLVPGGEGT